MNNIDVLIAKLKEEIYKDPLIKEYFRLKEAIKNNDTSADIDRQVKVVENQISDVEK